MSVRIDAQHDVVGRRVVDEGPLGVHEEDVGHPDLLHQTAVERHALVGAAAERQALVLPVMSQVQRHGEVLGSQNKREGVQEQREGSRPSTKSHVSPSCYYMPENLGHGPFLTMSTSEMLSKLSTWTSTPTGMAGPAEQRADHKHT